MAKKKAATRAAAKASTKRMMRKHNRSLSKLLNKSAFETLQKMAGLTPPVPALPPVDSVAIAKLLADSNKAHEEYRDMLPRMASLGGQVVGVPGDPAAAREAMRRAFDLRAQAENLDPDSRSAVWPYEPMHHQILVFYMEQLAQ